MKIQNVDDGDLISDKKKFEDSLPEVIDNSHWTKIGMLSSVSTIEADLSLLTNNENFDLATILTEEFDPTKSNKK